MAGGVIYPNACETILNNIEEIVQGRFLNVIKNGCEMVRETPV